MKKSGWGIFLAMLFLVLGWGMALAAEGDWTAFFEESPCLPRPDSFLEMKWTGTQEDAYVFTPTGERDGADLAGAYLKELAENGFRVEEASGMGRVMIGETKMAEVSSADGQVLVRLYGPEGFTFQRIPWGASPKQVSRYLLAMGLVTEEMAPWLVPSSFGGGKPAFWAGDRLGSFGEIMDTIAWGSLSQDETGATVRVSDSDIQGTVAGYAGCNLVFSYSYGVTDGQIDRDHLSLETVAVRFLRYVSDHKNSADRVYKDLTGQLNDAYGKYTVYYAKSQGRASRYWYGAENTAILLGVESSWMGDDVILLYADTNSAQRAKDLLRLVEQTRQAQPGVGV